MSYYCQRGLTGEGGKQLRLGQEIKMKHRDRGSQIRMCSCVCVTYTVVPENQRKKSIYSMVSFVQMYLL